VGFEVVDQLAAANRIKLVSAKHRAITGSGTIAGSSVLLMKPLTYMNLSGQSVAPLAKSLGVKPNRILVIADDLDLDVGKVKMRLKGSAGGHNGHKSLIASLGTEEYPRLKIGIGHSSRDSTIDHVLSRFPPNERELIDDAVAACVDACELVVGQSVEAALQRIAVYNARFKKAPEDEGP
jgi:PTH1 family peptidyl-tRNA hydrolase